jgi:hypothetical protein
MNGYVVQASDFAVTATPIVFDGVPPEPEDPNDPNVDPGSGNLYTRKGKTTATDDPHRFNFVLLGLKVNKV